jgi:hypothetical protein
VTDPCLSSCRPAGETRPLTAINVTLSAADYRLSWRATEVDQFITPTGFSASTYRFPGAVFNGTFALTPSAADPTIYEYKFSQCGRCSGDNQPSIRYYTGGRTSKCQIEFRLTGLYSKAVGASASAIAIPVPTCAVSEGVQVYWRRMNAYNCGTRSVEVANGSHVAALRDYSTGAAFLWEVPLRGEIEKSIANAAYSPWVYLCDPPCTFGGWGGGGTVVAGHEFRGHACVESSIPTVGSMVETGTPEVTLTNITTTYG